ncbi:kojibiose phosphorylase [Prosthecochloris sp. GSB1]|uniref:glycoside hydrolase family 65 protein n=1 Tax=Prosthecochloris sp. GSB1 TaxID=281093 RepID=UPI000B8D08F1|nr:glycosyl hydrolase family 65 protein [Prosthecochloris sp. GSB1]ASQ90645.1 kojibiose phosphorylase [Prosthecochloris sp. GSB1]
MTGNADDGNHFGDDALRLLELSPEPWLLKKNSYGRNARRLQTNETLMTIGNGYLNIRGSLEELPPGSSRGMYINGIYDKSEADVEELVKCPVWTDVSLWIDGEKVSLPHCRIVRHVQMLDMKKGALHRKTTFRLPSGKTVTFATVKLVFLHMVHWGYMRVKVVPENFSGEIRVLSGLNGDVLNRGFFPEERLKHLLLERIERGRDLMYLEMRTRERGIRISTAASWRMIDREKASLKWEPRIYGEKFTSEMTLHAEKGDVYRFEKYAVVYTGREIAAERMFKETICGLKTFMRNGASREICNHLTLWDDRWRQADILISGDRVAQKALRYNIYQLLINGPERPGSIGAKFLSSEGYLGHVFWDTEIFIFPFYLYNFPRMARNMLLYRYATLPGAVMNAASAGYRGAKYGWETATTGEDVTPRFASKLEKNIRLIYTGVEEDHIVSDVVYAIERYCRVTGDLDFLRRYALEMMFQTARFWASRVVREGDGFVIRKVIGPDEFHEHVDNNAYTNYLVSWHLKTAVVLHAYFSRRRDEDFARLSATLSLEQKEVDGWEEISRGLKFRIDPENGLIEQFDGYFRLRDYVVKRHDKEGRAVLPPGLTYRNIHRTRLIKQADVIMLFLLFPHAFRREVKRANYEFYEKRTLHKSSLSHCTHAMVGLAIGNRQRAYRYFMKTVLMDIENLHGNTDLGIHAAAVGGAWQTVVMGFGGLTLKSDRIVLKPWLPKRWTRLVFSVHWRGRTISLDIDHVKTTIIIHGPGRQSIPCTFFGSHCKLTTNETYVLGYQPITCEKQGGCYEYETAADSPDGSPDRERSPQ